MNNRGLLLLTGLCALAGAANGADSRRPNILFLFSDDQRADTIGALGNAAIRTPALDRLIQSGTAFTRAYCMGGNHAAVCIPSRAMLMTGRSLFRIDMQLKEQETWPQRFGRAGYATFLTGKWHNGLESALRSFQQGKAVFVGGLGDPYKIPLLDFPTYVVNPRVSGQHAVRLFADAAVDFIRGHTGDAPFLCYVSFISPHDPRIAPPEYHERLSHRKPPPPANFLPQHPFNNGEMTIRDERLAPWPRTPEVVRDHLADYYACIEHMDDQIARILDALESSGHANDTVIVFASDHGLAIGSHGLMGKQNLYDHSMHAPLIFAGPRFPKGRQADALCYLNDIYATLGDLAGVSAPEGNIGRSLVPVLTGTAARHRESIFTAYVDVQRAVRDERWKLIVYPRINRTQLFDLAEDPNEMRDLASDPAHADQVAQMMSLLEQQQTLAGDSLALRTNNPEPADFDFTKVKRRASAPPAH